MRGRLLVLSLGAVIAGTAIAWIDSRPGWDDTGITAGLLVAAGFACTFLDVRHRAWWWALLIGLPTPVLEIPAGGSTGSLLALALAAAGAFAAWIVATVASKGDRPTPP